MNSDPGGGAQPLPQQFLAAGAGRQMPWRSGGADAAQQPSPVSLLHAQPELQWSGALASASDTATNPNLQQQSSADRKKAKVSYLYKWGGWKGDGMCVVVGCVGV